MKWLLLAICLVCVLHSNLVYGNRELYRYENNGILTPESPQKRQDSMFNAYGMTTAGHTINRHLSKMIQNNFASKLINGMNQGTRMIRQVLKRPKMMLVPKVKKLSPMGVMPASTTSNHRFQVKNNYHNMHKKPYATPIKDEVHETTHHHTYSEEHIHIDEEDVVKKHNNKPVIKSHNGGESANSQYREMELREEKKVEAAMSKGGRYSEEIINGKPYDSNDDWKPIEKPKPASKLNTFVMDQPIAKQVHHQKHIIDLEFENKPVVQIKATPLKHDVKPTSHSIINTPKQPNSKRAEGPKLLDFLISDVKTINPDYFYNKKFNENVDYLQAHPSNKVETTIMRVTELNTHRPPPIKITTTDRPHRAAPSNYTFRINPIEMPTVTVSTLSPIGNFGKTSGNREIAQVNQGKRIDKPSGLNDARKKHKNLVAQTMNRGSVKFDTSEK